MIDIVVAASTIMMIFGMLALINGLIMAYNGKGGADKHHVHWSDSTGTCNVDGILKLDNLMLTVTAAVAPFCMKC